MSGSRRNRHGWLRSVLLNVVSGLIVGVICWPAGCWSGRKSLSGEIVEGLALLDLGSTSDSLEELVTSFDKASSLLSQRTPHPADPTAHQLLDSLDKLSQAIGSVRTTEYYSVEELKQLASPGGASSEITLFGSKTRYEKFIDQHIGKPKRTVEGLAQLQPRLEIVRERAASIAHQLAASTNVDLAALEAALAEMKREASTTLASLQSRQAATLETLKKFGKTR